VDSYFHYTGCTSFEGCHFSVNVIDFYFAIAENILLQKIFIFDHIAFCAK